MKRLLSLTLAAALLAALTLPAAAEEETQDARLARVTALVKKTLALDTEGYETFRGGLSEDLAPVWELSWEDERRSLSVSALEDGTVVSLYRWEYDPGDVRETFPAFPESGGDADRDAARDFLSRVLRKGENAELKEKEEGFSRSSGSSWSGTLTLNGLPSPLHWSIRVANGVVEHFDRDVPERTTVGGVPSPDAPADAAKAGEVLAETLKLQLEYVLAKPGDTRAVLRYVPEKGAHDFLVDAKTGELLDLTELEAKLDRGLARNAAAGDAAAPMATEKAADEAGLTRAEQEGVRQMEGVLAQEELDKALRAVSAYGLRGYALTGASYESVPEKEGQAGKVTCTLHYARTDDGERLTRNITVDAKTGDVESIWSSAPYGREKTLTEADALKKAESFLKSWRPDWSLTRYQTDSVVSPLRVNAQPYWQFTFAQEVNGLPFRGNAVHVGVDAADGSIYSLSYNWDKGVTFDDANGMVSMETALAAWAETYETVLAYRNVPQKLHKADPAQAKLLEQGMEYYYGLRLTYGLERTESCAGVDAKTGEAVQETRSSAREPLVYDDLAGSAAKADIEKLAKYGAGYAGGKFRPGKTITQWELVCLVSSLRGGALEPEAVEKDARESAYYEAYRLGLLRSSERSDNAALSRGDVVKMLLNAAGYGPAARLEGIFTSDLRDFENQPAGERGYAAIAQALGMVSGSYAGTRAATRGEAASMLCRVLEREA